MAKLIRENKETSDEQVLRWITEIIYAIEHLHNGDEYKCAHRDIKPGNIYVSNEFIIKLGDFSHSRLKDKYDSSTGKFSTNVGTNKYQSPQIMNFEYYTYKTDCWYEIKYQ